LKKPKVPKERHKERNDEIVTLYVDQLLSSERIASYFGLSGTHVRRILNKRGVPTDKGQAWRETLCKDCRTEIWRRRSEIRRHRNLYCDDCAERRRRQKMAQRQLKQQEKTNAADSQQ